MNPESESCSGVHHAWTKAVYRAQELPDFQGNPLIEALPPILSAEQAYDRLCKQPMYNNEERNLSPELRFHALYRLQDFFQPVMKHLELERKFSRLIRSGYISRSPLDPNQVRLLTGQAAPGFHSMASSFTLMGFSGIGKTTAIERVLSLYPQAILHERPINRIQIVWLKLNCPHDGSLKSLCMDFFLKIDNLLGTNYFEHYGKRRLNNSAMVTHMGQIARIHCIGALIIDEIQHLLTSKDKGSEKMMNFFVTLINEIGIPVILIGTMRARSVLQKDFRQARRGSGQGDMVWEQMKPDDNWDMLIEELWRYQWTREVVPLSDELRLAIYEESQGIIDIAVKLYSLSQSNAIATGLETITPKLIRKVAHQDLKLVQPMLDALRSGLPSEIQRYEDIKPMDLASILQTRVSDIDLRATMQKKKEQQEEDRKRYEMSVTEKAILALIGLDVDSKLAERAVQHVLTGTGSTTQTQVVASALSYIEEQRTRTSETRTERQRHSLIELVERGKERRVSGYQALKEGGVIKNPLDEFAI